MNINLTFRDVAGTTRLITCTEPRASTPGVVISVSALHGDTTSWNEATFSVQEARRIAEAISRVADAAAES